MRWKVMIELNDWDHSIEEYDGVIYETWEDACKACIKAKEYFNAYIIALEE